jgi:alkylhydroperoxidase family enzyme
MRAMLLALVAAQAVVAPRVVPVADRDLTDQQRAIVASYVRPGQLTNDVRVLLTHPDSVPAVVPFADYIAFRTTLPAHDRAMLMLRTAWLSRSPYLWAKYATAAQSLLTPGDLRRLGSAPIAADDSFDAVLLRAVEGLHRQSFIDDSTWMAMAARYSTEQLLDAVFTVANTTMLAGLTNSAGVPIDAAFSAQPPAWPAAGDAVRRHQPLTAPRIEPLEQTFWTGELRVLLDPDATGRPVANIYRTLAKHPALYRPRQELSEYIRTKNTLPPRLRELAILRIGALCGSDYEWGAHAPAGRNAGLSDTEIRRIATTPPASAPNAPLTGWNAPDAAVLRAADELYGFDVISGPTWAALSRNLDSRQRIDLLITVGGYRMVSMALNSIGVPLEEGSERIRK